MRIERTARAVVLVVDDDSSMGETLALCLNRRGFDAISRRSGREALELLDANGVDVIVTDLNMDEMSGLVLCERVGVLWPGLPVIVTTGFGAREARIAAGAAGAFDVLAKPIDLDLLRATIDRAVLHGDAIRGVS